MFQTTLLILSILWLLHITFYIATYKSRKSKSPKIKLDTADKLEQAIEYNIAIGELDPRSDRCESALKQLATLRHREKKIIEYHQKYSTTTQIG
jgi:hypothetical protein